MIVSPRLILEPVRPSHAPKMFAGLSDPRGYTFMPESPPESVALLAARYRRLESGKSPDGSELWRNWMIRPSGEDTDFMGYVQATVLCDEAAVIIAYHIFPNLWGAGYGREAVAAMLSHCRDKLGVREARAYIDTRNLRSLRLVEALKFTRAGLIKDADYFHEATSDEYFYTLEFTG